MDFLLSRLTNPQLVALGCALLGAVSGLLGTFAVLRKQSLLGDAISHAALPGIVLAFLVWRSKEAAVLVGGAAGAGLLAALAVMAITRTTRIKYDGALGLALSTFYGFGVLVYSYAQKNVQEASQAGLRNFFFGLASTLSEQDVAIIGLLGGAAVLLLAAFWKEFKLLSFDPDFGASLGLPMRLLDVLLTVLLVVAIVIGLQIVGVVLMSAMLVAPAVAARQWTDRLGSMALLAMLFGALAGLGGAAISDVGRFSTGPVMVLAISLVVVLSLLLAPNRGLLWNALRQGRNRRQLRLQAVLHDLYGLSLQHESLEHGHPVAVLRAMSGGWGDVERSLHRLAEAGWARQVAAGQWALTPAGKSEAERLRESEGTAQASR